MDLKEALSKYSIDVPSDEEFYSKEYQEYFSKRNLEYEEKFKKYEAFHEMYTKSFYTTFYIPRKQQDEKPLSIADSKAVVLGGQTGAGKSGLVSVAKREAHEQGREIFLIDDDMYRKFYPKGDEILKECPEFYIKITAIGSSSVTPKLLKYASDNKLNFIFDGTMKNPRIINTAQTWDNYDINWKIMATSRYESLLSIFERNRELEKKGLNRFINVPEHDETYYGIEKSLAYLESLGNMGKIQVYKRGIEFDKPILVYNSEPKDRIYDNATSALITTRNEDKNLCIKKDISGRIKRLKQTANPLNHAEFSALEELEKELLPNSISEIEL